MTVPSARNSLQRAGGAQRPGQPPPQLQGTPPAVLHNQKVGTAQGYRHASLANGIAARPDGLFDEDDPVLLALVADQGASPFEKHLPGADSPYEALPQGGWITGNQACQRGVDLRLFYKGAEPGGQQYGRVVACVRFGEGASIGNGFFLTAHGGAIETVLDEATAELGKVCWWTG
jgi:hypothetical protein